MLTNLCALSFSECNNVYLYTNWLIDWYDACKQVRTCEEEAFNTKLLKQLYEIAFEILF